MPQYDHALTCHAGSSRLDRSLARPARGSVLKAALPSFALLVLLAVPDRPLHGPRSSALGAGSSPAEEQPTLDQLLGRQGRKQHADLLAKRFYHGNVYTWQQYSSWGRELIVNGFVEKPPTGKAPSAKLSEHYRCVHCHNLIREDVKLTVQDPESRLRLIRDKNKENPEKRDGTVLSLTPGTTLWGAVNRERFYNGHYRTYHRLTIGSGRRMDPEKLADAVEVCCRYCSGGRFPDPWELDSILAYLWDMELRLSDLDLDAKEAADLRSGLESGDPAQREPARQKLKKLYLLAADAQRQSVPVKSDARSDTYEDQAAFTGDAKAGKFLYLSACAGCHGTDVSPLEGKRLVEQATRFHSFVWKGTERDGLYMPFFPKERLSRQQAADIRAYLLEQ